MSGDATEDLKSISALRARLRSEMAKLDRFLLEKCGHPSVSIVRAMKMLDYSMAHSATAQIDRTFIAFGVNPFLANLVPHTTDFRGFPLFAMSEHDKVFGATVLHQYGRFAFLGRLLDLASSGVVHVELSDERVVARRNEGVAGTEMLDLEEPDRFKKLWSELVAPRQVLNRAERKQLRRELRANVRTWRSDFIGYDSTPLIDRAYAHDSTEAMIDGCNSVGLHPEALLDGVTGADVVVVASALHSLHAKHAAFCTAYLKKFPEKDPANVLTIWARKAELLRSLTQVLPMDCSKIRRCIRLLTLTSRNAHHHLTRATSALPALIEIGQATWLRPLFLAQHNLLEFAAREINRCSPATWSRCVNMREDWFRMDLFAIFADPKYLKLDGNRKIRESGRVLTDIDAVILDRESGTLAVFQLKWQDPTGWDERERVSKATNLVRECRAWADTVLRFTSGLGIQEFAERLGLRRVDAARAQRLKLFIVGRHGVRFTGFDFKMDGVCRASWPQLQRLRLSLIAGPDLSSDPLTQLYDQLLSEAELTPVARPFPVEFSVAGLNVVVPDIFYERPSN